MIRFFDIKDKSSAIGLVQSFATAVILIKEVNDKTQDTEIQTQLGAAMLELSKCLKILSQNAHSKITNELYERADEKIKQQTLPHNSTNSNPINNEHASRPE